MNMDGIAKRRLWPIFLLAAGLFLLGFLYDMEFAGIPYQDPPPEMSARYARHANIAAAIRWCGVMAFLLGSLMSLTRWYVRRFRSSVVA